jgi:TctA family transporter
MWAKLAEMPYQILFPSIVAISCVGSYTIALKTIDLYVLAAFCLLGYVLVKLDCEMAPMLFGVVVGPMLEENLRRALLLSRGDPLVFLYRPISAALLALAAASIIVAAAPKIRARRDEVFRE